MKPIVIFLVVYGILATLAIDFMLSEIRKFDLNPKVQKLSTDE